MPAQRPPAKRNTTMSAVDVACSARGSGPPLYFVHGIGARKEQWNTLVDALEGEFMCVSYDLRGHGESPVPDTPYRLDQLVEDLEALRARLGHERIHVVGHSLGGMIGPAYARAHPERVLSLGLLSTAAGRSEEDRAKLAEVLEALRTNGIANTLDTLVDRWFTDEFLARRRDVVQRRLKEVVDTPEHVFLSVFEIYSSTEMGSWLHEIECPCLVLTAEFDGGCNPRLNRFIAGELKRSDLVILDGLKHDILNEASDRVVGPLLEFLRGVA